MKLGHFWQIAICSITDSDILHPLIPITLPRFGTTHPTVNFDDLELGLFKVIQGQRWWCQSIAHERFPIGLTLTPSSYLSPFLKYLTCNFDDLGLRLFKVIRSQRSWCRLIAHGSLYSTYIDPVIVSVTVFEIFDVQF